MRINLSGRIISRDKEVKTNQHTYNPFFIQQKSRFRVEIAPTYINYGR